MTITREQGIMAKSYLYRAAESTMLAYHADEKWSRDYWLREVEAAFKQAATELGFLVEPVSKDAAGAEALALSEANGSGAVELPTPASPPEAA